MGQGGDQFMQQWAHLNARAAVQRAPTAPPSIASDAELGNPAAAEREAGRKAEDGNGASAYISKSNPHKVLLPVPTVPPTPEEEGSGGAPPAYDAASHPVYHKKNA